MKWKHIVEREDEDLELDGTRFFRGFLFGCLLSAAMFVGVALLAMLLARC